MSMQRSWIMWVFIYKWTNDRIFSMKIFLIFVSKQSNFNLYGQIKMQIQSNCWKYSNNMTKGGKFIFRYIIERFWTNLFDWNKKESKKKKPKIKEIFKKNCIIYIHWWHARLFYAKVWHLRIWYARKISSNGKSLNKRHISNNRMLKTFQYFQCQ